MFDKSNVSLSLKPRHQMKCEEETALSNSRILINNWLKGINRKHSLDKSQKLLLNVKINRRNYDKEQEHFPSFKISTHKIHMNKKRV